MNSKYNKVHVLNYYGKVALLIKYAQTQYYNVLELLLETDEEYGGIEFPVVCLIALAFFLSFDVGQNRLDINYYKCKQSFLIASLMRLGSINTEFIPVSIRHTELRAKSFVRHWPFIVCAFQGKD